MKTLDKILIFISWLLCVFVIGLIGNILNSDAFIWVASIIIGIIYGKYIDEFRKK